jgi:hypothetical protein
MVEIINKSIQRIIWIYSIDVINRSVACDAHTQDYYMSKPLAPDALEPWLKTRCIYTGPAMRSTP